MPWDSLIDRRGQYLLVSHVVTTAPSATVLYLIRRRPPSEPPTMLLEVGDVQYRHSALRVRHLNGGSATFLAAERISNLLSKHPSSKEFTKMETWGPAAWISQSWISSGPKTLAR